MSLPSACSAELASSSSFSNRLICCSTCLRVIADDEPLVVVGLLELVERERVAGFFAAGIAVTSPSPSGRKAAQSFAQREDVRRATLTSFMSGAHR